MGFKPDALIQGLGFRVYLNPKRISVTVSHIFHFSCFCACRQSSWQVRVKAVFKVARLQGFQVCKQVSEAPRFLEADKVQRFSGSQGNVLRPKGSFRQTMVQFQIHCCKDCNIPRVLGSQEVARLPGPRLEASRLQQ